MLVENFRPGTLERQGLGYEALRAINPGLIYCSISGYGQTSLYALRPGYDFVAQAEFGLMSVTGEIDGDPQRVGSPVGDVSAGVYACISILAALRVRDHTGKGQHIDISLLETTTSLLSNVASNYLISGEEAPRLGNGHPNIAPITLLAHKTDKCRGLMWNYRLYQALRQLLGRHDLAKDPSFATNPQ